MVQTDVSIEFYTIRREFSEKNKINTIQEQKEREQFVMNCYISLNYYYLQFNKSPFGNQRLERARPLR